jgi:hypothetical protein
MVRARIAEIVNGEAVYGTVLVAGLIYAFSLYGKETWALFTTTLGTVVVFWIGHVYAEIVANRTATFRVAVREAFGRSAGLLWAMIVPLGVMLLAAFGALPDSAAVTIALWAAVVILGILGWFAVAARRKEWWARLFGALLTAALGFAIIALKALIH